MSTKDIMPIDNFFNELYLCAFLVYNIVVEPIISSPNPQASKKGLQKEP